MPKAIRNSLKTQMQGGRVPTVTYREVASEERQMAVPNGTQKPGVSEKKLGLSGCLPQCSLRAWLTSSWVTSYP